MKNKISNISLLVQLEQHKEGLLFLLNRILETTWKGKYQCMDNKNKKRKRKRLPKELRNLRMKGIKKHTEA